MKKLFKKLNNLNITVDSVNGRLDIQAPKGVMTKELLEEIKLNKNELLEFLNTYNHNEKLDYQLIPEFPIQSDYALSSSQHRVWLLSQIEEANRAYNMSNVFKLKGSLEISILEKAFVTIIERHEILRTIFRINDSGEVRQIILPFEDNKFQLQFDDFSNGDEPEKNAKELVGKEVLYSFDLSFDSLIRARVIKISSDTFIFSCVMHHIVSDGWSSEIMIKELFALYNVYTKGGSNPLLPLRIQYKDYTNWQQEQLKSESIKEHKDYWLSNFSDEIKVLDLPESKSRPVNKTYNGNSIKKHYDKDLVSSFKVLGQSTGSTLFMNLLAVTKILFYKYTDQKDIVVGSPIAGREHLDLEDQIGFYVNTLALRTRFEAQDSFNKLLARVKKSTLAAYRHQAYPFDELIEHLDLKRDKSRNPLFDVMITIQNSDIISEYMNTVGGVSVKTYEVRKEELSKFDLEFVFQEKDDGLDLMLSYNSDIYSEAFVKNIAEHLEVLMQNIIKDAETPIRDLNYLTTSELHELLVKFNNTTLDYPKNKTVIDLFAEQVKLNPDNVAIVFEDQEISYKSLDEDSNCLSNYLLDNYDLGLEDLISVELERSDWLIISLLAILKTGCAYVPIDTTYPAERVKYIKENSKCKVSIDEDFIRVFLNNNVKSIDKPKPKIGAKNLAYVIYTSGSTGRPKGVMIEHESLVNLCSWHRRAYKLNSLSRGTLFSGVAFDASVWEIYPYLVSGGTLYPISKSETRISIKKLSQFLKANKITHTYLPSQVCQELIGHKVELGDIKILTGGDVLKLSKQANLSIYNNYGPTENTVVTSFFNVENLGETNISIGKPIDNIKIYILSENLGLQAKGVIGELCISGVGLARAYLHMPELTDEKFIPNPFLNGERMYRTGDLARWLPDGNIEFIGRKDSQVKIRGHRIELGEIENTILGYSDKIIQVVVLVIEKDNEKVLVAYYTSNKSIDKSELRHFLQGQLSKYMIPSYYVELDSIPLTSNGKVDRKKLPIVSEEDMIRKKYVAPRNELEKELVKIWQEILGVEVGITDNFFESGGHSLVIAQVINRIQNRLGQNITFKDFFVNPTIQELSKKLKKKQFSSIPKAPDLEYYSITSAQFRFWLLCQMENINIAYNIPFTLKMEGDLNIDLFKKACGILIKRHEALRTCFVQNQEGEVKQRIIPVDEIDFDISIKKSKDKDSLKKTISKFNKIPFDLAQAKLFRVDLIITQEKHFYICINIHHIISDGQSVQILIKELAFCYNSLLLSDAVNLAPLRIQFKDYAEWMSANLLSENVKEKEFWLNELSGELPILNLPTYQTRPVIQTYNGANVSHQFNKFLLEKLTVFSNKRNATLFMTLLSAINGLIYRYTRQRDIILGTPVSGRENPDIENQVGLYINTIPIRTRFEGTNNFEELLNIQKEIWLRAYSNSNYPFEDMIKGLDLNRDTSRSPIFDILVIHQKHTEKSFNLDGLFDGLHCYGDEGVDTSVSKFDITFSFTEFDDKLILDVEYNTDLYKKEFIENFIINLEDFINECIKNPKQEIQKIAYLNEVQEHTLIDVFNETKKLYDDGNTVVQSFVNQATKTPLRTAIICENQEIIYKDLDEKSTQLGKHLRSIGVTADTTVGICLGRSIEMVIGILGILKSGASYLPLDPFYPIDRIDYILEHSNTNFVVANEQTTQILPKNSNTINLDDSNIWESSSGSGLPVLDANSMAYVIYTSGSTGKPKGVRVSHKNLINFIEGLNYKFGFDSIPNIWLAVTSISFDISIVELLWTLTKGDKVVLHLERPSKITSMPKMNFSLFYFPAKQDVTTKENKYRLLLDGAKFADKKGFEAIWVPERHFHNFGDQFPNPSIAAAAVSTITKKLTLRSGSVVLPLHDPVRVAEEWSMIDNLSEGRVELSIASGWHPNDFVLAPDDYNNRHQIMRDKIRILKDLWEGNSLTRKNGIGEDFEFFIHPKPIQEELPLWITSAGGIETFKYAGSIGANILTHLLGQSIEDLAEKIKAYRESLQKSGFDPKKGKVALMLHTFVSDDPDFVKKVVEVPFKNYLRNSFNLLKPIAEEQGLDVEKDIDLILDMGFLRFYNTSSLFGTPETCLGLINKLHVIGVDEIACLIDFGVEEDQVISNLDHLNKLKELIRRSKFQQNYMIEVMDRLTKEQTTTSLMNKHKITHIQSTPSFFEELLLQDEGIEAVKKIDTLLIGGEVLKKSLAKKLIEHRKQPIYNMYGPTETTIWSTIKTVESEHDITIGSPIVNTQVYVLDQLNQLCPIGVSGELCIGGDGVSLGYLNNQDLTESKFVDNPFVDGQKIYKTGDLACWLPSGELEFLGRLDSQVKVRGYRIELKEIESVILEITDIYQCVVSTVSISDHIAIIAYVKSKKNYNENFIKDFLRLRLPNYMIPQNVLFLDDFPYTPNGKIDIKKLPNPGNMQVNSKKYTPPRNKLEEDLVRIWEISLNLKQISIDDNFFEIGGNSMKAFQLLSIINKELKLDLTVVSFFQYPTIKMMSDSLGQQKKKNVALIEDEMENLDDLIDFMKDI